MTKQIKVPDKIHAELKAQAEKNFRTLAGQLEFLVYGGTPTQNTPLPKKYEVGEIFNPNYPEKKSEAAPKVDDLFAVKPLPEPIIPNPLPDAIDILHSQEQFCCHNEHQPCKHWVWDSQSGEGYRNMLSGRMLEVE